MPPPAASITAPAASPARGADPLEAWSARFPEGGVRRSSRRARVWTRRVAWNMADVVPRVIKRTLDLVVASTMLALLLPLLVAVATLIKLTDGGPALFWQWRVGRWGRQFRLPKFRSMSVDADERKEQLLQNNDHQDSITFKMKRDPRVTWIGRIIRKSSIDELPQLWSIVKGDMSLVGPRPPVPSEVAKYTLDDRRRLEILPGLTCIWQVSGRGTIPFARQVELDLEYIERRSLKLDLWILLRTIPAVISGKGAY